MTGSVVVQLLLCCMAAPLLGATQIIDEFIGPARRLLNHARNTSVLEIVIFGDSYSDIGRYFSMANGTEPPPQWFYNGRYSNGPLWHEYVEAASNFKPYANDNTSYPVDFKNSQNGTLSGLTYTPPVAGSEGFKVLSIAVAASPACRANRDIMSNDSMYPDVPWLGLQIDEFEQLFNKNGTAASPIQLRGYKPLNVTNNYSLGPMSERLCVIETGGNDYLNQFQNISNSGDADLELSSLPEEVAGCILTAARRLLQMGEKFLLIFTLPPVNKIPQAQALNIGNLVERVASIAERHNTAVRQGVASLQTNFTDAHIWLYEMGNAINQAIVNPASFNLTDTEGSCLEYTSEAGDILGRVPFIGDNIEDTINTLISSTITGRCNLTEKYAWFDRIHPTAHLHQLIGEDVAAFLQQHNLMSASGISTPRRANTAPPVNITSPPAASSMLAGLRKLSYTARFVTAVVVTLVVQSYLTA